MELLRFERVSFAYPDTKEYALKELTFSMEEGEFLVVCGASGCGKTTLLKMAKPQMRPTGTYEGTVFYKETELEKLDAQTSAFRIGYVQQNPENQIVTDTVWHELAFGLENEALPVQTIRRRVSEMASFFGMEELFHKKTCELSGGQKQMLNLASVMAMEPELLILDEPTSMLDPLAASSFLQMVHKINRELGVAVLLCEHRLEEVFPAADRILLMERGKKSLLETPQELAQILSQREESFRIYEGLPAAVRIFAPLQKKEYYNRNKKLPLTIRDGRIHFKNMKVFPENLENPEKKVRETRQKPRQKPGREVMRAREVWFRYERNAKDILRSLDLSVKEGEMFALLGGNGAGKSTLLKLLTGIVKERRGKIFRENERKIAMLPQNPQILFQYDTVWEELLESSGKDTARAKEMAEFLELSEKCGMHPYDLSGGEMQRAAIGKLLLQNAGILLLDEPTKGLDAYLKKKLAEFLKKLVKEGMAILFVTHDLEFAAAYADRCGLLFDGQVISEEEPHAFFAGNRFYTTAANQIAGDRLPFAITCEEVVAGVAGKEGGDTDAGMA